MNLIQIQMRLRGARQAAAEMKAVGKAGIGMARDLKASTAASLTGFKRMLPSLDKMKTAGTKMRSVGSSMNKYLSLPIAAAGAGAVYAATKWESSFAGVRKTVDATKPQLAAMEQGILSMSTKIPTSARELAEIAESAGALGIQRKNILGFTRTIADLGETTNLAGDEGASSLARFANITGMAQSNFGRLGSTIVDLGNKGASTESEIAAMGLRIAAAGTYVGMTEPQILGWANALSSLGIEAEAGGTSISQVFKTINSAVSEGGQKLEDFAKVAGMSSEDFATAWEKNSAQAAVRWIKGLDRMKKAGQDVPAFLNELDAKLRGSRIQDTLMRAAGGKGLAKSLRDGTQAWKQNVALANEARKRYETLEAKTQMLKNMLFNLGVVVGSVLIPILSDMVAWLGPKIMDFAKWFEQLPGPIQKAAIAGVLLLAAVGPLVWMLGSLLTATAAVGGAMTALAASWNAGVLASMRLTIWSARERAVKLASAAATGIMTAAQWALNVAMTANPIGIVVVAIAALVAGFIWAYKNVDWFRKGVDAVWSWLKGAVVSVINFVKDHWQLIVAVILGPVTLIAYGIYKYWDQIKGATSAAWNWVKAKTVGVWNSVKNAVVNAAKGSLNFLKNNWKTILAILTGPIGIAVRVIMAKWGTIKSGFKSVVSTVSSGISSIVGFVGSLPGRIASAVSGAWDSLVNGFKNAINTIIRAWNGISFSIPKIDPPGPGPTFGGQTIQVPQIPELEKGGRIITPGLTLVGDAGPELLDTRQGARVVPLPKQPSDGGSGTHMGDDRRDPPPVTELHSHLYIDGREIATHIEEVKEQERAER